MWSSPIELVRPQVQGRGGRERAKKRYKPEAILCLRRQTEVLHGQGMPMADALWRLGVSEVTLLSLAQGARGGWATISLVA